MWATFLNFSSIGLTAASAWFLSRGTFMATPEQLAELATSKWDHNLDVAKGLCAQYADSRVRVVLLGAILAQLLHASIRWRETAIDRTGLIAAVILSLIAWDVGARVSDRIATKHSEYVAEILRWKVS